MESTQMKSGRMKPTHIAALLIIACLMGYIMIIGGSYSTYETFDTAESTTGKDFKVVGELVKDRPMYYEPEKDPNLFSFYMKDKKGEIREVIYKDSKPPDFERSQEVVVSGHMQGDEFMASEILLKCPSKYTNEFGEKQMEEKSFKASS